MFTYKYEPIKLDHTRFAVLPTALIVWLLLLPLISLPFYESIEHYLRLYTECGGASSAINILKIL